MKRLSVLVAAAGLLAGAAAYQGITAGRGMFRVQDARCEGSWNGSLMLAGIHGALSYDQVYKPGEIGMEPGSRVRIYEPTANVGLSPARWFELFCWGGGALQTWRWAEAESVFAGYHNLVPGAKLSLPVIPVVKLGAVGAYSMYPSFGDARGSWAVDSAGNGRFGLPFVNGPTWTALATFDFPDLVGWAPALHLNYGQAYDKDEEGVETDYTTIAGALEYQVGKLDLFAEFVSVQSGGAGILDNSGRVYVTPGIKVGYLRPLVLQAGVSLGLTDNVPEYEIIAGLGLSGRLFTPRKPTTGTVKGRVTDAASGIGLPANVAFPGLAKPAPVATGPDGSFAARGVKAGTVAVRATSEGYVPSEQEVEVAAGRTVAVEFVLEHEKTTGSIAGKVTDPVTDRPLPAMVSLDGGDPQPVDEEGEYTFDDVSAGKHRVEASSEGYMTASSEVRVAAREQTMADFRLVKVGVKITLKVYFDFDKAELRPESHQALADAAKIMKDNPSIKVEIQGHTDGMGSADYNQRLSLKRAQAVVDYLVKLGVDAGRLEPKGFGKSRPVASNDTEDGRAQNRRVEFLVLE